jgi:predicted unusual protein kinase regulating ubiquinone biosynthesis (AarF/ABC1/UbiB family)
VAISLKPQSLKRYRDLARLLAKYGRSDVVREAGLDDVLEPGDANDPETPPEAEQLAADLEAMGPTFVKLGQLLSTRADLLPAPYLKALTRLQDDVEPLSFAVVEETVERELGVRISDAFSFFDHVPLASASLGQVHRAAMRDGRPVAVKVQRPDIREVIDDDMTALADIASFLDKRTEWGRKFGFTEMLDELRQCLMSDLE